MPLEQAWLRTAFQLLMSPEVITSWGFLPCILEARKLLQCVCIFQDSLVSDHV